MIISSTDKTIQKGNQGKGFHRVLEFQKPMRKFCRCSKIGCEICDIRLQKEDLHEVVDYSKLCTWLTNTHKTGDIFPSHIVYSYQVIDDNGQTRLETKTEPPVQAEWYQNNEDGLAEFNTLFNELVSKGFEFKRVDNPKRLEVGIFVPEQDKFAESERSFATGYHFIKLSDLAYIWRPESMKMQQEKILASRRGPETDLEKKIDDCVGTIYTLDHNRGIAGVLEFNDPEATFMFVNRHLSVNDLPRYRIRWMMLSAHRGVGVDFLTAEQVDEMLTLKMHVVSDPDCRLESVYPQELRDEYGTPPSGKFKWMFSHGYGSDRIKVAIREKIAEKEEESSE